MSQDRAELPMFPFARKMARVCPAAGRLACGDALAEAAGDRIAEHRVQPAHDLVAGPAEVAVMPGPDLQDHRWEAHNKQWRWAVAALRSAACAPVRAEDHTAVLKI